MKRGRVHVVLTPVETPTPIEAILAPPVANVAKGTFSLSGQLFSDLPRFLLYFDTDLDQFTGWLSTRGYEYVAEPRSGGQLFVNAALRTTETGLGGPISGFGTWSADGALNLDVPLSALGDDDGRFAWELMIFDSEDVWLGSYGGRFV